MKNNSRRTFLTRSVPACIATCLAAGHFKELGASELQSIQDQDKHKFDQAIEMPAPLTFRGFMDMGSRKLIAFGKYMVATQGEKKTIKMLRGFTEDEMTQRGKADARRNQDTSFKSYINMFRRPRMKQALTFEIIEDTDTVFEIKVTECLSCEIFKNRGFDGELGYACVCHGDHAWAESYNPKIKLIRNKTLMQGDAFCNHRYVLKS